MLGAAGIVFELFEELLRPDLTPDGMGVPVGSVTFLTGHAVAGAVFEVIEELLRPDLIPDGVRVPVGSVLFLTGHAVTLLSLVKIIESLNTPEQVTL